jgi:hypothetical protein
MAFSGEKYNLPVFEDGWGVSPVSWVESVGLISSSSVLLIVQENRLKIVKMRLSLRSMGLPVL